MQTKRKKAIKVTVDALLTVLLLCLVAYQVTGETLHEFGGIAMTALCGMAMSAHAVPFLYGMLPVSFARRFHLAMSFWSFILMGLHLGLHIPAMTAGMTRNAKASYYFAAASVAVAGAGFWLFVKNGIPDYIFFRMPFAFFDYDKPAALVFLENIAILTAFAFLGAETDSFIKAAQSKGNARKSRTFITAILVLSALLICAALTV